MSSRARRILGLIREHVPLDNNDRSRPLASPIASPSPSPKPRMVLKEIQSDIFDSSQKNVEERNKSLLTDLEYCEDANENDAPVQNQQMQKAHRGLVSYDFSDSTISDDDMETINMNSELTGANENDNAVSSCSSSSSTSSTDSSSSSSSSDSDSSSSHSLHQSNLTNQPNLIVNETNDDDVIDNTPSIQDKTEENISITKHKRPLGNLQNYTVSPIFTDESDIDLSDNDPTYIVSKEQKKSRNFFIIGPSSSETSDSDTKEKRGRKRRRCPAKWKQNKIRRLRNQGKTYVSMSKKQTKIQARSIQMPCTEKCRLKCSTKINMEERYELFRQFWDIGDLVLQRSFIRESMMDVEPKYKYTNAENPRRNNKAFYFKVKSTKIRVCKTFYKATLNISDRMIYTVQTKVNENGFTLEDLRGKHQNHKKNSPELLNAIRAHINSIPRIESHYLRAQTTREYIDGSKNVKDLYNDFKAEQENQNKPAGNYITYYKIFTGEYNISFHQPKKDQCDLCTAYTNATVNEKSLLEDKYNEHLEEKACSRIEKKNDRKEINENVRVAVYDLQAVMQCPRGGSSSAFYYKSKLNCFNFTVTELNNEKSKAAYDKVHSYFWTESDAKRGAIEIGSCIWNYLTNLSDENGDAKDVIFYSDNCCGQNKNKYIASIYMYAVQNLNIKSITHKFLIRGHTQNEADSVHSLIEREINKNLKSGPIYTPDQYVTLIKNSKKTSPTIIVHEFNYESFYDLKELHVEWGYNFSTNRQGASVNWNNIKVLKMMKEDPTSFLYKTSYKDDSFKEVDVRNKRKKMQPITDITLKGAYEGKQELSANKKKDLRDLVSGVLIPSFYKTFYNSII